MTYVVGDSHAMSGFFGVWPFAILHMGPRTAYKLKDHDVQVMTALRLAPPGVKFIFSFGYVDCAHHIFKQSEKQQISIHDEIHRVVTRYSEYIYELRKLGFLIYPISVSPPGLVDFGIPRRQVRSIIEEFNIRLRSACIILQIPFIDIYNQLIDVDGYRIEKFAIDPIHMGKEVGEIVKTKYPEVI